MPLEAMSSIIAIGLLGKLFQMLFLQPFHEMYIMTLQCGLKKRVTTPSWGDAISDHFGNAACGIEFSSSTKK